ncbi:MAG: VanZ family protein [Lachnospiraceae bacterium]|nr:VanZ family protein [Lachnospiraceae bacterium]
MVEIIQVIFRFGIGDIDDIILNSIGGLVGILIYRLLLICKDDLKVCCIIAIFAPIGGILSFGVLFFYNNRF